MAAAALDIAGRMQSMRIKSNSSAGSGLAQEADSGFQTAPKPPRPQADTRPSVALVANAFTMEFQDRCVYSYDINIKMVVKGRDGQVREIPLVKESKDDFIVVTSKEKCLRALYAFTRKYTALFTQGGQKFYDLQRLLYTTNRLPANIELLTLTEMDLRNDVSGGNHFLEFGICELTAEIKRHSNNETLFLKDFDFLTADQIELPLRHDLPQFLEIASSDTINSEGKHVSFGGGVCYQKVDTTKPGDTRMSEGCKKNVRFLEPTDGSKDPVPSIILDSKKAFFHVGGTNLADKVYSMKVMGDDGSVAPAKIPGLTQQLKHLFVFVKHLSKPKYFAISGVEKETCMTKMFPYQATPESPEVMTSVAQYFASKYGQLQYPNSPVIKVRGKTGDSFYPMEKLYVCPDQRLKSSQMTPEILSNIIRSSAVLPKNRLNEIRAQAASLKLHEPNCNLGLAGVQVSRQLMSLEGHMLKAPVPTYAGNARCAVEETGRWKTGRTRYIQPMKLNNWAVYHLSERVNPRDSAAAQNFVNELIKEANNRGMNVNRPHMASIRPANLKDTFAEARQYNTEFMLFLQDETLHCHEEIKSLERYFELTTQDLNFKTVRMVNDGKRLTLENILNKTNVKLGGVNYSVRVNDASDFFKDGRLYLGVHINRSSVFAAKEREEQQTESSPMIVGLSSNITDEPCAFVGDFFFAEQNFNSFKDEMEKASTRYAEVYNSYTKLKELIVYFSGLSDGDFAKLGAVINAMRADLERKIKDVKLTVMVVSKSHNVRLLPKQINGTKATEQNMRPGTVVDRGIVHARFAEFFLNSHLTLQGTARAAKYTLLVNDCGYDLPYLESMSYTLAYGHQIVAMPTSLPTPVYVARSYAERGTMLLKTFDGDTAAQANANLSYQNTKFANLRLNA